MSDKTRNLLIGILTVGIIAMTVAYAALSQTLNISGYSSDDGYDSDFADVPDDANYENITTADGLEATGLKGYSLAKAKEMLTKGASSCSVAPYIVGCDMAPYGNCGIYNEGNV